VRYHIQRLESEGKIILKKIGKFTRLYRNSSTYNDREMVIASHVRNATSRQLLEAILECPGMTNQRLSERFNIDKSTVYVHMQKLISDEIVVSEIDGKQKRYFIADTARPAVIKLLPLNYQCPGMLR
jgi:predicted transcriptional regulator